MAVVLALDPGERRTGIAASDSTATLASPLRTHDRQRDGSLVDLVAQLVDELGAERVLVGLPLTQMGEPGVRARHAQALAAQLRQRLRVDVELVDERYTTAEAARLLAGRRAPREQRDALAASLLLQTWLDSRRAPAQPLPPSDAGGDSGRDR
jgi:putative Holliday junction resolvase